jgi:hypothetical protein
MDAVRTLKANLKLEGKPCGWCQAALVLGDDAAVCAACEQGYHRTCWDDQAGCATHGCATAPLRRLDAPAPAPSPASPSIGSPFPSGGPAAVYAPVTLAALPPGMMSCPRCTLALAVGTPICPVCRAITSPDGLYHGPKINAPGAVSSLVLGIIGMVFCGIVFGTIAIVQANNAKRAIKGDPIFGGGGMATAGLVLGILGIVLFFVWFAIGFSNGMNHR